MLTSTGVQHHFPAEGLVGFVLSIRISNLCPQRDEVSLQKLSDFLMFFGQSMSPNLAPPSYQHLLVINFSVAFAQISNCKTVFHQFHPPEILLLPHPHPCHVGGASAGSRGTSVQSHGFRSNRTTCNPGFGLGNHGEDCFGKVTKRLRILRLSLWIMG